jgi:Arc/MetJ-type ribon-helix-helix transcriptional regulator
MTQLVARIDDDLASDVDRLVALGIVSSRSDAVRQGLRTLIDTHERSATADAIIRGYRDTPQTEEEVGWADEATRLMITEEPW